MSLREQLEQQGWRQGSIIELSGDCALTELLPDKLKAKLTVQSCIAILMTYSCAVISGDFDKEPWLNILIASPINQTSAEFVHGKNPRTIHFHIQLDEQLLAYEANSLGLIQIERELLLKLEHSQKQCTLDVVNQLKYWCAQRFIAPTFDGAFMELLRSSAKKFKKLWKREEVQELSAVYIEVKPKGEGFQLDIILALRKEGRAHRDFKKQYEDQLLQGFKTAFSVGSKITVENITLENEFQLSLSTISTHKRFSPYYPTFSIEDSDIPADMNAWLN